MARMRQTALFGTSAEVTARLRSLAELLGVDEVAVLTTLADADARRHSYALLAREFGLSAPAIARGDEIPRAAE
jgi:alkanesulfonate monooxygenase SsuD/methylene tetrahydromethanopterin reductase-like flavin-dependent oxidoreductase (luciferase family)